MEACTAAYAVPNLCRRKALATLVLSVWHLSQALHSLNTKMGGGKTLETDVICYNTLTCIFNNCSFLERLKGIFKQPFKPERKVIRCEIKASL